MENKKIRISLVTFIILIVVLIVIIGFGIFMANNYAKMQTIIGFNNKLSLWIEDDKRNEYEKTVQYDDKNREFCTERWTLGKLLYKSIDYSAYDGLKHTTINIGSKCVNYVESDNGKLNIMYIEDNKEENEAEYNEEYTEESAGNDSVFTVLSNTWQMKDVKIKNTELNGKKCYEIVQPMEADMDNKVYTTQYIDVETGLPIKVISYEEDRTHAISEYSYGTVTEKDIAFLDNAKFTLLDFDAFYDAIDRYHNQL